MLDQYRPQALAVLRIVSALLFLEHGTQKLLGFPDGGGNVASLISLMGLAGIVELVGGILLVLGFKTRIVAFILSGGGRILAGPRAGKPSRCSTAATPPSCSASSSSISSLPDREHGAWTGKGSGERYRLFGRFLVGGAGVHDGVVFRSVHDQVAGKPALGP